MGALRDFVTDLLAGEGAAIEPVEPDGLDVLAPERLRTVMGWPEFVRLGFGGTTGAMAIGLEGDWLDRFGTLLGERGRFAERQFDGANVAPGDPERLLERALDLPNAVWRLRDAKPAWTRCLLLAFRYTAISDEKREGLVWLGVNQGTGAVLDSDMVGKLRMTLASQTDWHAPDSDIRSAAGRAWDATTLGKRIKPTVVSYVRRDLEPFLKAVRRRFERDRGRIQEYHDDLRRTAQLKLAALDSACGEKAEADRKRESLRIAAIEREYAAKLDDLRRNYALRVTIDWMQGLTLFAPVHRYDVLIKRRKGERTIQIDWHPAARAVEPPRCDWGTGEGRRRLVCDDHLHLTDQSGQAPCPSCSKSWCRACQPAACPRCGKAV